MNRQFAFQKGIQLLGGCLRFADDADGGISFAQVLLCQLLNAVGSLLEVVGRFHQNRLFVAVKAFHLGIGGQKATGIFADFIGAAEAFAQSNQAGTLVREQICNIPIELVGFLLFDGLVAVAHDGVAGVRKQLFEDGEMQRRIILRLIHHHLADVLKAVAAEQAKMQV